MTEGRIPDGTVTAADLYGAVEAARREVGQILTRVEVMDDRHARSVAQVADHETRLRVLEAAVPHRLTERLVVLERWQWRAIGVVSAITIVWGLAAGLVLAFVPHHG